MTEKPTQDDSNTTNSEIISAADLAMINEASRAPQATNIDLELPSAAEAARRAMETAPPVRQPQADTIKNTLPLGDTPPVAESVWSAANRQPRRAAAWGAAATVAAASVAVGVGGLITSSGGDTAPEIQEGDKIVNSVTLLPEARIRQDPKVDDAVTGPNTLLNPEQVVTIESEDGIRIHEDTDNGTWYGISTEDLATKIPEATNVHDTDGVVWVNEQGLKETPEVTEK